MSVHTSRFATTFRSDTTTYFVCVPFSAGLSPPLFCPKFAELSSASCVQGVSSLPLS